MQVVVRKLATNKNTNKLRKSETQTPSAAALIGLTEESWVRIKIVK